MLRRIPVLAAVGLALLLAAMAIGVIGMRATLAAPAEPKPASTAGKKPNPGGKRDPRVLGVIPVDLTPDTDLVVAGTTELNITVTVAAGPSADTTTTVESWVVDLPATPFRKGMPRVKGAKHDKGFPPVKKGKTKSEPLKLKKVAKVAAGHPPRVLVIVAAGVKVRGDGTLEEIMTPPLVVPIKD